MKNLRTQFVLIVLMEKEVKNALFQCHKSENEKMRICIVNVISVLMEMKV